MTSQIITCIYLDELDKYIIKNIKIKGYIRYMDDGVVFHQDKEYLKYCLSEIEKIVKKYKLEINSKTKIYKSCEEVEFIGFRIFTKNNKIIMKINNKTKKKFKRNINDKNISSYLGHLSYGNCKSLIRSVVGGNDEEKSK